MVSIIIPNYNGEQNLKNNLPKVLKAMENYGDFEIIVVDDNSADNSWAYLEDLSKKNENLRIFRKVNNSGFSPTVNEGIKISKGDFLVLLNSDVYPKDDFLRAPIEDFEDDKVFAIGFMDESIEAERIVLRGRGIGRWSRGFLVHSAGDLDKRNNLWASGGSSMFRRDIWEKLSGFDDIYAPFYWEDIDLSYRALKSGYKILFEKNSVVVHEHEKGSIRSTYSASQIKKIAYRNQFIFVWKNASLPIVFSNILWLPYHLFKALLNGDLAFILGFLNAIFLAPKIINSRFKVQKMFKLTDKEVEILN